MYKDKDKQREADRARQKRRRDKIKAKGVTSQGVTQGVTEFDNVEALLDDLHDAGKEDPKGDARPLVRKYMKKFGIKEDTILDRIANKIQERKNG